MDEFETFPEFLNRTREAEPGAVVVPEVAGRAAEPVAPAAFEEMKAHVLSLYDDVPVEHSFVAPDGQYVDCVPIDRQPGLRRAGEPLATPATPPAAPAIPYSTEPTVGGQEQRPLSPPLAAGGEDAFGNTQSCPPGTIPVRRVTLEEIGRFGSLERFFKKVPRVQTAGPPVPPAAAVLHRYAHAFQTIDNFGGISNLNFWMPVPTTDNFSLSQHWYVGGAGGGLQTVEGGWQVYPWKYSTPNPVLFIYWTADAYGSTGAYNLDAPGFVQTDASWVLGGGLSPTSIAGGTQYEFTLAWERNPVDGNWWLFLGVRQSSGWASR